MRHLRGDRSRAFGSGGGCKPGSKALLAESIRRRCPSEVPTSSRWDRQARRTGANARPALRSQLRNHRKSTRVAEVGAHALVPTGGSSMAEAQPQPKSPTSLPASTRRVSPHRVYSRQPQPSPTGHDRARAPRAGLTAGNRSGFPPQPGSSSPTDRHHSQLTELARSSPALRGQQMTSVPPAKIGASPEALHDEGVRSQAAASG